MYTVKSQAEFIEDIRALDESLNKIRLSGIEIDRKERSICYDFICNNTVDQTLQDKILSEVEKITAPIFASVQIKVKKIVSNDQLINSEIFKYISKNHPSLSIFLKPTDVRSVVINDVVKYVVKLTDDGVEYFAKSGALAKLNEYLAKHFCSDFVGSTERKDADETVSLLSEEVYAGELQKIEHRTIKVKDVVVVDDATIGDTALYIEDVVQGDSVVCGKITEITERETKNGKPFFIIHIDDTTGKLSGVYFTKKNTYPKIKDIAVGECIIARGTLDEYNGRPSFTFNKINRCSFPTDFVKKDKYKKTAPREYKLVFPTKPQTIKINSIFDSDGELPSALTQKTFVVFDLETTGLDLMNNGITEIGAVKVKDGKIYEQFTSLIKPDYPITKENEGITGISEEMVKDAPKISAVLPDFMKFIENCTLVAHNAEFDTKFIKRFAGAEDYEIKNEIMDTMLLAREQLPFLKHSDLKTVATHFGIAFHHHRALSDAYATAEAFIELMKLKYK